MSHLPTRVPDVESESRLADIRRKAAQQEPMNGGVIPLGAPFPPPQVTKGYYEIPLLKEPQWTNEIPLYFFVGGAAGAAAVVASAASIMNGDPDLVRSARWVAALGGLLSPPLLISDLGMPSRFLNMLRVFKVQSPMSVGAWTLMAFSTFSAASVFTNLMRRKLGNSTPVALIENAAGMLAAASGRVMASYTGVLVGATVIPVWNKHVGSLPMHFAASGLNSAVSILELMNHDDSRALNILGLAASGYEIAEGALIELDRDRTNRPLQHGRSGFFVRLGGLLSGPVPFTLRIAYALTGNKKLRRAAALSSLAGSLLTRFGWVEAGKASARDYQIPLSRAQS
jgi:hypothetical protein